MTNRHPVRLWFHLGCLAVAAAACTSAMRAPGPAGEPGASAAAPRPAAAAAAVAPSAVTAGAPDGSALVTVYRKGRMLGAILNTSVYVDGVEVANLDGGTYVRVAVAPGAHRFRADEEKDTVTLEVAPGKAYYFRMGLVAGLWKGHGKLEPVAEAVGSAEFAQWKLKLASDIRRPEMVVRDPSKP